MVLSSFEIGTLSLAIRRMPAFFETFPVILIDQGGTVRADIPFRRAESRYSMVLHLYFAGGILNATEYSTPSLVKDYARKAQFGQIFTFEKKTGWYSFSHTAFALFFFFGHLWHASRAVFKDLWTGLCVTIESLHQEIRQVHFCESNLRISSILDENLRIFNFSRNAQCCQF
jgi:photosystem II CP47 chlorophyll apoprotein